MAVFEANERVLCFHGPQLYEAKVLDVGERDNGQGQMTAHYLIHYNGWNKRLGEGARVSRVDGGRLTAIFAAAGTSG